jgi:hypothetical protein
MLAVTNGMAGTGRVPDYNRKSQGLRYFIAAPHFSSDVLILFQGKSGILESTLNGAIQYEGSTLGGKTLACILVAAQAIVVLYATGQNGWDAVFTTCLLFGIWVLSQWGQNSSELWKDENWNAKELGRIKFTSRKSAWFFCALQAENYNQEMWFQHVLPLSTNICLLLKFFAAVRKNKPKTKAEFYELYVKEGIDREAIKTQETDILAAYQMHIIEENDAKNKAKKIAENKAKNIAKKKKQSDDTHQLEILVR